MAKSEFSSAVLSVRSARPFPWYGHVRATEDLFADVTGAKRFDLEVADGRLGRSAIGRAGQKPDGRQRLQRRLMRQARAFPWRITPDPAASGTADLGIMWASDLGDVGELLDADPGWTSFADTRVLVVSECWPGDLALHGPKIRALLERFDAVFACMEHNDLAPLTSTGTTVGYLPHGVVTDSYRPRDGGERPIGVLNYGRRDPAQHDALRAWRDDAGTWYHYDTMGLAPTPDPVEHQRVLGRLMSGSTFSVCNLGRFDETHRTQNAQELGARFYEGLGAGCLLLGSFPASPVFEEHFGDLPGMVGFPLGADQVPDDLLRLLADPEELARIHRAHRARALSHHDIAHRIAHILDEVGFDAPAALAERQAQLRAEANALLAG